MVPGLIDMHCHIYPTKMYDADCLPNVNGEAHMFQSGVTTAVDAGTCGSRDFLTFKEEVIDKSKLRILAFINIAAGGMVTLSSEDTPSQFYPQIAAAFADTFPEIIVGIKTAHYRADKAFDEEHPPWASVDSTIEAAKMCGKNIMVDLKPNLPECSYEKLLKKMRKGDIHTHMYAQQFPVLDEWGHVNEFLIEARQNGIYFDLGHGEGSFVFNNAILAYEDGFLPDSLSSDLYMGNIHGSALNLLHIMSKYLSMGMSMEEIILRTTTNPAKILKHQELGSLKTGSCADVAILRKIDGEFGFTDCEKKRIKGTSKIECLLTIREGSIVYDPYGISMGEWVR